MKYTSYCIYKTPTKIRTLGNRYKNKPHLYRKKNKTSPFANSYAGDGTMGKRKKSKKPTDVTVVVPNENCSLYSPETPIKSLFSDETLNMLNMDRASINQTPFNKNYTVVNDSSESSNQFLSPKTLKNTIEPVITKSFLKEYYSLDMADNDKFVLSNVLSSKSDDSVILISDVDTYDGGEDSETTVIYVPDETITSTDVTLTSKEATTTNAEEEDVICILDDSQLDQTLQNVQKTPKKRKNKSLLNQTIIVIDDDDPTRPDTPRQTSNSPLKNNNKSMRLSAMLKRQQNRVKRNKVVKKRLKLNKKRVYKNSRVIAKMKRMFSEAIAAKGTNNNNNNNKSKTSLGTLEKDEKVVDANVTKKKQRISRFSPLKQDENVNTLVTNTSTSTCNLQLGEEIPTAKLMNIFQKDPPINKYGSNIYNASSGNIRRTGLRYIIIDGSNVAMGHSNGRYFSCEGLKICIEYFLNRGHQVKAFVPQFRRSVYSCSNKYILETLGKLGHVIFTPSRQVNGNWVVPYDDRYIVQCAAEYEGIIVSNDNYRDLLQENPKWRDTITNRILMWTWVDNMIMFPPDPLGRRGPNLEQFLRFPRN